LQDGVRWSTSAAPAAEALVPALVRPALRFARAHAGTIYNVGMTASALAFLATDILHLRCLSVFGTCCAIWFNAQRAPPWNAVRCMAAGVREGRGPPSPLRLPIPITFH
jgi:hypothetical protein